MNTTGEDAQDPSCCQWVIYNDFMQVDLELKTENV